MFKQSYSEMGIMKTVGYSYILLGLIICCKTDTKQLAANSDDNKVRFISTFESFVESVWNDQNMDTLKKISSEKYSRKLNGIEIAVSQSEMEAHMNIYFKGFPDMKVSVDKQAVTGNRLFAKWTFTGTNTGVFGESAATGKKVNVSGYSELTFDQEGRIIHEDCYYNELELLQQLGYTLNKPVTN